jgi:hypothetical protein
MRKNICETNLGPVNQIHEKKQSHTSPPLLKYRFGNWDTGHEGLKISQKYNSLGEKGALFGSPHKGTSIPRPPQKGLPSTASEYTLLHSETFMFAQTNLYHQISVTTL